MKKSLVQVASIAFLGGLIGRGLRYGLYVVIARALGPEALGLFAFGMVVMKAGSSVARSGLDNAAQKYIPIHRNEDNDSRLVGTVVLCLFAPFVIGSVIASILYLGGDVLTRVTDEAFGATARLFLLGVPLFATMMVGISATQGFKETKYAVYIRDLGQSGLALILAAIGGFILADLRAVVLGYLVSLFLGVVLAIFFLAHQGGLRLLRPQIDVRDIFTFSIPLLVVTVTQYIISWTDILMLGIFVSPAEVGWYQAAYQTSVLLLTILYAANSVFPAIASDLYSDGQHERLQEVFVAVTKWVTYLTLLGGLFIIVYAEDILTIFGTVTPEARTALILLAIGQVFTTITGPVGFLLIMTGYERLETANTVLVAVLNLVLNFVLIQQLGIIGAAVATSSTLSLLNVLRLGQVWHLLGQQPYTLEYWKGGIAIIGVGVLMIFGQILPISSIFRMLLVGSLSLISFALVVWWLGVDEGDQILLESLR